MACLSWGCPKAALSMRRCFQGDRISADGLSPLPWNIISTLYSVCYKRWETCKFMCQKKAHYLCTWTQWKDSHAWVGTSSPPFWRGFDLWPIQPVIEVNEIREVMSENSRKMCRVLFWFSAAKFGTKFQIKSSQPLHANRLLLTGHVLTTKDNCRIGHYVDGFSHPCLWQTTRSNISKCT